MPSSQLTDSRIYGARKFSAPLLCLLLVALFARPAGAQGIEARVDALLQAMTLEQQVGQLFMVTLHGEVMTQDGAAFLRDYQPGAVSLFTDNVTSPEGVTTLTNNFQATMVQTGAPPLLIAIDQEGGLVTRMMAQAGFTQFPAPAIMGAAGAQVSQQMGIAVAEELAAVGVNMNLAPVADLETNRDNPIIFRRAFGSDPVLAGEALAGYTRGMQLMNVLATAKHFPGHGETSVDSHAELPRIDLDRERVLGVEVEPFRHAIRAGTAAIMVGHLWYPALDPVRRPASLSPLVVTDLLRDELGFAGIIVTDAMDMNAVDMNVNFYEAVVQALEAGVDMLALGPSTGTDVSANAIEFVLEAVRTGRLSEARIAESARRVLLAKARFGVLDWRPLPAESAAARVRAAEHEALITSLFQAGVTVAYDRFNLVPVNQRDGQRLAIIFLATRYQIRDACLPYTDPALTQWVGISDAPSADEISWAAAAARTADTAIVFTQDAIRTREQADLVNALPPEKTIAVAIFSPYDWQLYPNVGAYMATYSPARPAVPAACDILFGARPGLGRLSVTLGDALPAGSRDEPILTN
jgi:beta-N-acetylhexosaminidase